MRGERAIYCSTFFVAALFCVSLAKEECESDEDQSSPDWIANGGFILFFVLVAMSFWGLAVVCEDYFVPALNLLCDDLQLDNDVAGATIMAAGNSSPELFACLISLFVTKTALGAGTAIGSAIFNHLCICSGSVLYAKDGTLQLNWKILARECLFYGSSLFILVWALKGNLIGAFKHAMDHVGGHADSGCLSVHWYQAFVLLLGYVLYAIVCSNYRVIVSLICPGKTGPRDDETVSVNAKEKALFTVDASTERIGVNDNGDVKPVETYEAPVPMNPGLSFAHQQSFSMMTDNAYRPSSISVNSGLSPSTLPRTYSSEDPPGDVSLVRMNSRKRSSTTHTDLTGNPLHDIEEGPSDHTDTNGVDRAQDEGAGADSHEEKSQEGSLTDPVAPMETATDPESQDTTAAGANAHVSPPPPRPKEEYDEENLERNSEPLPHAEAMAMADAAARLTSSGGEDSMSSRVSYSPMEVPHNATFECWMYKRSRFYSRIRVLSSQKWQLRYFKVDENGLWYARHDSSEDGKLHVKPINIFDAVSVYATDLDLFEFVIVTKKRKFVFRCATEDDFMGMFSVLAKDIRVFKTYDDEKRLALAAAGELAMKSVSNVDVDHDHGAGHDLMTPPSGAFNLAMHYVLLPLKAMIYYSIPEISVEQEGEFNEDAVDESEAKPKYQVTIWMCIFWLGVLSYVMNYCLEELGLFFGIASGTMGLTFGAAGTSFPNLLSSMIVAKQGLGDMAVSNAFGSNVFCIFFGLGFPWLLYILSNGGEPYEGLKDDGIVFAVVILLIVLFSFMVLLGAYAFRMQYWMGSVFLFLYGIYLLFAIVVG